MDNQTLYTETRVCLFFLDGGSICYTTFLVLGRKPIPSFSALAQCAASLRSAYLSLAQPIRGAIGLAHTSSTVPFLHDVFNL
jgi:hypothetical protein